MLNFLLITIGAFIMFFGIIKYYSALIELKTHIKSRKLFSEAIYTACLLIMVFFLTGYIVTAVHYYFSRETTAQDLLISLIFLFGSIFVLAMVTMARRMFVVITDKAELKKQLMQQELMTTISQSFTTTGELNTLIYESLKMSGEFIKANHVFLSRYIEDEAVLDCKYEWYDSKAMPFIGGEGKWSITPDMEIYKDLAGKGHAAVDDWNTLTHQNFKIMKNYNIGAFLNIPIDVSGKLWGVLGFIFYETPYNWEKSDINFGRQIAGILSGVISQEITREELIKAKNQAEMGYKLKNEFLSRMSHEMRTPMNAIIGMTKIANESKETDRKNYCLEKINSASTHLLGVIDDILDMSKIDAGKLELSCTEFVLKSMLEKIISVISYQMAEKKQYFVLSVDENVPKIIKSDEQRLSQVITNLLINAVKFTPCYGTITLSIRSPQITELRWQREKNNICLLEFEVKDTGIGISEENQNCIFKPFTQADGGISRKYGGSGLGLSISKRIVEMMNGSISVKSAVGLGTSFIFDIQAENVKSNSTEETSSTVENQKKTEKFPKDCFKNFKLLIAEDIDINREIVEALLEFTGVSIDFAENGNAAYNLFAANPSAYNMIFMDIHMPEINGYEATRMIRLNDNPHAKTIPIIAMTADVFHEDVEKCLAVGMNGHVGKPLEIDKILEKISKHCILAGLQSPQSLQISTSNGY
jgi:signal transduction histidine kinase